MNATPREGSINPDALAELLDDFRPFLEESLILAIAGDYDLTTQAEAARDTLQLLACQAEKEESSTFNPSGFALDTVPSESAGPRESVLGSTLTDETPILSSVTSDSSPDAHVRPWSEGQDIPEDEKEATLIDMFPEMKVFDVKFELQRANGDFEKAMLALLNIQYLDDAGELQRGTVAGVAIQGSKSRKKAKGRKNMAAQSNGAKSNLRLGVAYKLKPISLDEPDEESSVITSKSQSSLHSPILGTDSASPARFPSAAQVPHQSKPPSDPSTWQKVEARKPAIPNTNSVLVSGVLSPYSSASLRDAAGHSFDQAHNAWRRGRSDPLFRTAAVVYAERGHSQVGAAQIRERADYEALVDRQSAHDPNLVDLHGVPVREGVEMALTRTRRWWRRLVETEEHGVRAAAKQKPFIVVTGSGTHSAGGVSRLRQSVGVALARDGWCVEAQTAKFVVSGRKKP